MTLYEETKILTRIYNSRTERAEQRVRMWLPRDLKFIHYDEWDVINPVVDPALKIYADILTSYDGYRNQILHLIKTIIKKIDYSNVSITGTWETNKIRTPVKISLPLKYYIGYHPNLFT